MSWILASDGHIFVGEVILTDVLIEVKLVHDSYIVQKLVMGISYMYFTFQRNLFYNTNQWLNLIEIIIKFEVISRFILNFWQKKI